MSAEQRRREKAAERSRQNGYRAGRQFMRVAGAPEERKPKGALQRVAGNASGTTVSWSGPSVS